MLSVQFWIAEFWEIVIHGMLSSCFGHFASYRLLVGDWSNIKFKLEKEQNIVEKELVEKFLNKRKLGTHGKKFSNSYYWRFHVRSSPVAQMVKNLPAMREKSETEVAQSFPTVCSHMDCSLPGFSVHGIFQARVPEWVAISFSKGFSQPRDGTRVSRIAGRGFTLWTTKEAPQLWETWDHFWVGKISRRRE